MNKYKTHPEIRSNAPDADKLMVLLHGVGSDGNDLMSLVPFIQHDFPKYHYFSPHGHEAYDMAPYGRQWFSLKDRTPHIMMNLIKSNAIYVQDMIRIKQKELNVTNSNTVIIGFSQGTIMGLYLTLTQGDPYKAMIAFSGRLFPPDKLINKETPICIIHGEDDDIVPSSESDNMEKYFKTNDIEHDKLVIPNLKHSIDAKGLQFAMQFLHNLK